MLQPLSKARLVVTLGADGKVEKVAGVDEIWAELAQQNPSSAAMLTSMKERIRQGTIEQFFTRGRDLLPPTPVRVGQSWPVERSVQVPFAGQVTGKFQCQLAGLHDTAAGPMAAITFTGRLAESEVTNTTVGQTAITIQDLDLKQIGRSEFNRTLGMFTDMAAQQDGQMTVITKAPDGQESRMTVLQSMEVRTTIAPAPPASQPTSQVR